MEFLIIGPLIAAMGATVTATAIVAVVAAAVAIPLGLPDGAFGSAEHVAGTIAVAVVGALAVAIAHLRSTRERNAARLEVQYGVARVLADAESIQDSAEPLLRAIAEPLGWQVGHLWVVRGETLEPVVCVDGDGRTRTGVRGRYTPRLTVGVRGGFAGQAWEQRPCALPGRCRRGGRTSSAPRRRLAPRSATGSPSRSSPMRTLLAVIELFSRETREPEPEMLEVTTALGTLIGEFMQRLRAAEAVRHEEAPQIGGARLVARRRDRD